MNFKDLQLIPAICSTLEREGYQIPTPIQTQAIPPIIEGRDILGCAQTGTGKTAAFALPVLQRLYLNKIKFFCGQIRVLVVAPTRELAIQVNESFTIYGKNLHLRHGVVCGGVGYGPQINKLKHGVDVLVATPGRLLDLLSRNALTLSSVEVFILDEADRMLDMGFLPDVKRITAQLPGKRQTMLFSATIPHKIRLLASTLLKDPVHIQVAPKSATADNIGQSVYFIERHRKLNLLKHIIKDITGDRVLVFSRTKYGADKIARGLSRQDIPTEVLHGNKTHNARQKSLLRFKKGSVRVLVATDIASRGIDIDNISHMVNYELPHTPETYVHRIGRTARAGASGVSLSFCDAKELCLLHGIERLIRRKLNRIDTPKIQQVELLNVEEGNRRTILKTKDERLHIRRTTHTRTVSVNDSSGKQQSRYPWSNKPHSKKGFSKRPRWPKKKSSWSGKNRDTQKA